MERLCVLFVSLYLSSCCSGVTINFQSNNKVPIQGNSLRLSCLVDTTQQDVNYELTWFSRLTSVQFGKCYRQGMICTGGQPMTRQLTADENGSYLNIQVLNRSLDEGRWICIYIGLGQVEVQSDLNVTVYTIPSRLDFTQVPDMNVDLSVTSARIQCTTFGCTYPSPLIQWLIQGQNTSSPYEVYKTVNSTGTGGSCVQGEQLYTSTLALQQNTTWTDNSDKVSIFSCRILYPDSTINLITSGSHSIRFAVRVTEVFLQQNNQNITSTLNVTSGEPVTLTCLTGISRPAPNIDWYIGSRSIGSGTDLTFTPSNTDHNGIIYCQAYNTNPNLKVNSSKPSLFVRVRVTEPHLQQNNQNITSTLIVNSGEPVTLACVTGTSRPDPIIGWYIGSRSVGSGTNLTFTPSTTDHNEVIFCQAYNIDPNLKVDSNKPRLIVRAAPKILDITQDYKSYVTRYTMIQFNFNSVTKENLTVTARHSNSSGLIHQGIIQPILLDNIPVNSSQILKPDFRATIAISIMSENDFGPYVIEVKNIVGSDSEHIQILRQITPEKPFSFHASIVQEKQLSLKWQSGYNGEYTQTFIVEISLDNITWNNVSQVSAGNRDGWFSTVIEDLIPGSEYYLRLYAYNIHGRGDIADVQLTIRTLKDCSASVGISVGGAVGVGVGGIVLGLIGAIIAFTIRRNLNGSKCSCFRSYTGCLMYDFSYTGCLMYDFSYTGCLMYDFILYWLA